MTRLAASGYFLVILSALGFSFKAILVKIAYGYGVDAMTLMLMRIFIALPFFLGTLLWIEGRDAFKVTLNDLVVFSLMGIGGIGGAMLFSFYAIELMEASLATLVVFTYPAMTLLMMIFLFREKANAPKIISAIATFLGLALVIGIGRGSYVVINEMGVLFGLLAALCYAFYNALSEKVLKDASPIRVISYCMVFLVGFFGLLFGNRPYPSTYETWGIAALLGVFTGFVPFLFYMYGVKRIGATRTAIVSSLGPVFTVLWASMLLGERLDGVQFVGMGIIVLGVMALRLKSPVRFVVGTGDEITERIGALATEGSPGRKLFALVYMPGSGRRKRI